MTDRKKFEEMLERLVNEDRDGAEELFHEIVVEKSREIYENLLEDEVDVEETTDEEVDEATDEEVDESDEEDLDESEEEVDENFFDEMDDEEDPAGDMTMDIEMPDDEEGDDMDMDMGDEEGEGDIEDRVMDLEDELEALKAEFEAMMGDEEPADDEMDMGGDEEMPMDMDSDEGDDEEMPMESSDDLEEQEDEEVEEAETNKSQAELMREYADKVAPAKMGDNGSNTKSAVASPNNMGGTSANIARGDTEAGAEAGKGSKVKGSALNDQNAKEDNAGNVNVPGAKAATKMNAQPKGHGAEKKGSGETGTNGTKSVIGQ